MAVEAHPETFSFASGEKSSVAFDLCPDFPHLHSGLSLENVEDFLLGVVVSLVPYGPLDQVLGVSSVHARRLGLMFPSYLHHLLSP